MSLVFIVYLLGLVEKLNQALGFIAGASAIATFVCLLIKGVGYDDLSKDMHTIYTMWAKRFLGSFLVAGAFLTLTPTKEISYAMLAAYGVEEIVDSERVQDIGGKSLQLIEQTLDKYLEEEKTND
ncbi:hypothetical protein HWD03_gp072 [Alteromonas phage vB_AmeM_PT11-V22]|uniref:Uncharacterized protein n=1 Tax=Alteromonas phage vB_AmeM_PT11-V22 TaxID=2704031 RepID=A0A6C0R321_9CAUD|nr:hypothetical protein HWD03_gp072 [Alteromonas phage vB_AmeM_PT11-V22]QHZ59832.1 hypothetical protein [Alteromonas phage vB_AmeM_PT11-V22]